jgi:starch phosphorylase
MGPGDHDVARAVEGLCERLPEPLAPLARVAYNYRWSWAPRGDEVFAAIHPDRWERVGRNPIELLTRLGPERLRAAAQDGTVVQGGRRLVALLDQELSRQARPGPWTDRRPVAFMCAEFGVHESLPIYSGGLGVLAGDIVKEASDLALPMVGVGLLYRTGYFHQRVDTTGMQHEYWTEADPASLPCVLVTEPDTGERLTVSVPVGDEDVTVQIWRTDVGRVPLYLLDTDRSDNSTAARWITSRLYEGNRAIRLAQYAVLGIGGVRALRAMGIDPSVFHLNEGHPALAACELENPRDRLVFTTHTPVPAGNETYEREQLLDVLGRTAQAGDTEEFMARGRMPGDEHAFGMTVFALRSSRSANGVSRLHGEVAREMWKPLGLDITHVTNGVHVPTWLAPSMRALLDRYLGDGWLARADDPDVWAAVEDIPDAELWAVRGDLRRRLVSMARQRAASDRLRRGEDIAYARAAERHLDPDHLTIGFARRLATYKRLYLVSMRPERALALINGEPPLQFLFAGKAHPLDAEAKELLRDLFELKHEEAAQGRMIYLEDYDLSFAGALVAGCDVWVNLPRPPMEASGTSGMKACLNGSLHLSVLDGWWAEAYDGANGWAIDGVDDPDPKAQDERHADLLFDLLEHEVVPLFHDRADDGVPHRWLAMVKASLRTNGPRFSATRMVKEYADNIYR